MTRTLYVVTMALFIAGAVALAVWYLSRHRRAAKASWQDLIRRLVRTNKQNLAIVALDLIQEDGSVRERDWPELEVDQIWALVGGLEGLERVENNCRVFIDIAVYVQNTYPQAVVVAEELRRNTRHIEWHINRLRAGSRVGKLNSNLAAYAQRAVASYYLMNKQILSLCEAAQFEGLAQLRAAV